MLKQKQTWEEIQVMEKTGTSGTSAVLPNKEYGFKKKIFGFD